MLIDVDISKPSLCTYLQVNWVEAAAEKYGMTTEFCNSLSKI